MAKIPGELDVDESVKDFKSGFEVIEPGWKTVVIIESEIVKTQAGDGKMLVLKYELQDGSGRDLPDRLNIVNKSEIAQKIGRAQLAKIAKCVGITGKLGNSDALHGRPFDIKVTIEQFKSNKEPYDMLDSNKVKDYRPKGEGASAVPLQQKEGVEPTGW